MGASITLMLAVTVFMLLIIDIIPASSASIPLIERYFIFCLMLMILIIVAICLISRIYNRSKIDPAMSDWTRKYILENLAFVVRARHSHKQTETPKNREVQDSALVIKSIANENDYLAHKPQQDIGGVISSAPNNSAVEDGVELRKAVDHDSEIEYDEIENNDKCCDYTLEEEWEIVGRTIDHCLFFSFSLVFVVGTICCFADCEYVH